MDISTSLPSVPTSLSFSFLTTEDVKRISVKQITNATLLDNLNRPSIGGLYDPALGPLERGDMSVPSLTGFIKYIPQLGLTTFLAAARPVA